MKAHSVPLSHTVAFLILLTLFAFGLVREHLRRIHLAYEIGKMEKVRQELEEEKRKLEALFARETQPEALLRRVKLLGYRFVSVTALHAEPAGGLSHEGD